MQLKKYYLIECVLCFMRLPCISFVHTPCLPCICSFCSFALLFVRSPDLCSFNHQFAFSLFIHSFAFSLLVPFFFFFFTHSFPLSFSYPFIPFLFHSLCFSHPFAVSVLHSLVRFLLHSLVTSLFCSNFFSQYFTVSLILFFFFFLVTHGSFPFLLVCWHAFSFATPLLFGFLSPSPLPYPLPLKFFLFFCPSVPSSLPICYFFVLNSQRNVSHFNPSKGCFIEKIFYKTVYSSYVVHGTAFRIFLSHLYCRRKETLHR